MYITYLIHVFIGRIFDLCGTILGLIHLKRRLLLVIKGALTLYTIAPCILAYSEYTGYKKYWYNTYSRSQVYTSITYIDTMQTIPSAVANYNKKPKGFPYNRVPCPVTRLR